MTENMVQALNSALRREMKLDENVVILGEDVGVEGGVFRVTDGLITEFGADRVRAVGGEIRVVKTIPLCLSFDHRVIDGAEAARFMNDLIGFLENPEALLQEDDSSI